MDNIKNHLEKLKDFPKRIPIEGTFELTVRCNLHCKMCLFRHDDNENASIIAKELTAEQWIDMAKQVSADGTCSLLITGGEPLLRPDFCEIWEGIYKQGFIITLYTNATLVNDKIMNTLRKYPPHKIGVTIYGAKPETYKKVCGSAQAFDKTIHGIKQLQTLPSIIECRTTIIKDNFEDADGIEKIVHELFGGDKCLTQTRIVTKSVRGACADVESCRLSPKDNVRLVFRRGINLIKSYIGDSYDENMLHIQKLRDKETNKELKMTLFGCNAGMRNYTISWDGKLIGCQMLGLFKTDALQDGFKQAWEDFPYEVKLPKQNETCSKCNKKELCNCCVASRYAETGRLNGYPEYVCKDTEIIYELMNKGRKQDEKAI